jgi:hypothetical protein
MELDFKVYKGNLMYIPEAVLKAIGEDCNGHTAGKVLVVYSSTATFEEVKAGLDVVIPGIELSRKEAREVPKAVVEA